MIFRYTVANYLLEHFYNKRRCSMYRLKSEDKRKNTFDEEDEDDENTVSRSSSATGSGYYSISSCILH